MSFFELLDEHQWTNIVRERKKSNDSFRELLEHIQSDKQGACHFFKRLCGYGVDEALLKNFVEDTFDITLNDDYGYSVAPSGASELTKVNSIKNVIHGLIRGMPELKTLNKYLKSYGKPFRGNSTHYLAVAGSRRRNSCRELVLPHVYPKILKRIEKISVKKNKNTDRKKSRPYFVTIREIENAVDEVLFGGGSREDPPEATEPNGNDDGQETGVNDGHPPGGPESGLAEVAPPGNEKPEALEEQGAPNSASGTALGPEDQDHQYLETESGRDDPERELTTVGGGDGPSSQSSTSSKNPLPSTPGGQASETEAVIPDKESPEKGSTTGTPGVQGSAEGQGSGGESGSRKPLPSTKSGTEKPAGGGEAGGKQSVSNSYPENKDNTPTKESGRRVLFDSPSSELTWDDVFALQENPENGTEDEILFISDSMTPSLLEHAASVALPMVASFLNEWGFRTEVMTEAGREARMEAGLPLWDPSDSSQFRVSCTPLLSTKKREELCSLCSVNSATAKPFRVVAPMIIDISNAYSKDYKDHLMRMLDQLTFVQDNSKDGTAFLRSSILRDDEGKQSFLFDCSTCPIVTLGVNALSSIPAEKDEEPLFHIQTELTQLFNDATSEVMRQIKNEKSPSGYVDWRTRYTRGANAIKKIMLNKTLSPKEQWAELKQEMSKSASRNVPRRLQLLPTKKRTTSWLGQIGKGVGFDNTHEVTKYKANLQIYKGGPNSGFGPHTDGCATLNSDEYDLVVLEDQTRLPRRSELVVMTTCLAHDSYVGSTFLEHRKSDEVLTRLMISGNHIHGQGPLCNEPPITHNSFFHDSQGCTQLAEQQNRDNHYLRFAITSRRHLDPLYSQERYEERSALDKTSIDCLARSPGKLYSHYNYKRILTKPTTVPDSDDPWKKKLCGHQEAKPKKQEGQLKAKKYFDHLGAEEQFKYYNSVIALDPPRDTSEHPNKKAKRTVRGIAMQQLFSSFRMGKMEIARDYRINKMLLQSKKVLSVDYRGRPFYPLFMVDMKPVQIGQVIPKKLLGKVQRMRHIINPNKPNFLALEHPYKSQPMTIDCWIHFVMKFRDWLDGKMEGSLDYFCNWHKQLPCLTTCGSGGSTNKAGNKTVCTSNYNDAYHVTATPQLVNRDNEALLEACRLNAPIAVMINLTKFLEHERLENTTVYKTVFEASAANYVNQLAAGILRREPKPKDPILQREPKPKDHYLCLGYCFLRKYEYIEGAANIEDVVKEFRHIPTYLNDDNTWYTLSFRGEKHYRFYLDWALPVPMVAELYRERDEDVSVVTLSGKGPLKIDLGKLLVYSNRENYKGSIPLPWVNSELHMRYLSSLGADQLQRWLDGEEKSCALSTADIFSCMYYMSAAVAARAQKHLVTQRDGSVALPLVCADSDTVPDWLRSRATPHPNSDYDVVNVFYASNAKALIEAKLGWAVEWSKDGCAVALSNECNRNLVARLLLMSVVLRMTGRVPQLHEFSANNPPTGLEELRLPTTETMEDFTKFILSAPESGFFTSWQHYKQIPCCFHVKARKRGLKSFVRFLQTFSGKPMHDIMTALRKKKIIRTEIRDILAKGIVDSCPGSPDANAVPKTYFLAHRILADVEMVLLGVFGEVTYESIAEGPGSVTGIRYWSPNQEEQDRKAEKPKKRNKASSKDKTGRKGGKRERFEALHRALLQTLKQAPNDQLTVMGWKLQGVKIVSARTNREFSMTDTEHICCKVYICFKFYHPSRQGYTSRTALFRHCWPLFEDYPWAEDIISEFSSFWQTHLSAEEKPPVPSPLSWDTDTFYVDKEPEEFAELTRMITRDAGKKFIDLCLEDMGVVVSHDDSVYESGDSHSEGDSVQSDEDSLYTWAGVATDKDAEVDESGDEDSQGS